MLEFIKGWDLKSIKKRRTPSIIYFPKKEDQFSKDVISTIIKLSKSFPGVFCYILKRDVFPIKINSNQSGDNKHVYSLCRGKIYKSAPANSYSELFDLFDTVFNECLSKYYQGYLALMKMYHFSELHKWDRSSYRPNFKIFGETQKLLQFPVTKYKYSKHEIEYLQNLPLCNKPSNLPRYFKLQTEKICYHSEREKLDTRNISPKFPPPELEFRSITPPS